MLKVKVKRLHPDAVIPKYSKSGDAGLDLTAISINFDEMYISYDTGLAFEIPEGYVGLIYPRSSISNKDLSLANAVGVVDSGYRGSVSFRFKISNRYGVKFSDPKLYEVGDRVGQLIIMPYPQVELVESDNLSKTERSTGGYGSSGA